MEELADQLSQKVQIGLDQARTVLDQVSKTILRKANPNKASELLSKLPSSITNLFSLEEKKQFTATQEDISNEELVRNLD
ncbi:MAG: hypothetical protein ICV56_01040, partial [Nitrososphaeraceae archaeon]|nr:hypothetical protein [Nitrososphaeraceae archaeon]